MMIELAEKHELIEELAFLLEDHIKSHTPLSLKDRDFIADNIPDFCIYEGIAYRIYFNPENSTINEGLEANCSWARDIRGIKQFY